LFSALRSVLTPEKADTLKSLVSCFPYSRHAQSNPWHDEEDVFQTLDYEVQGLDLDCGGSHKESSTSTISVSPFHGT
jgi:hypothetical protein